MVDATDQVDAVTRRIRDPRLMLPGTAKGKTTKLP